MGNTIKKKQIKNTKENYVPKPYKPKKIVQPTVKFRTFGGEPINIEPKYSYVCNGVKGGFHIF